METLKVRAKSNPNSVAGALANVFREKGLAEIQAIGASAVNQAIKAVGVMRRDIDYVVKDNEVLIVDSFTGRIMPGRRYSDGLHQAIEAKEGVEIQRENRTIATITFQNYFRMYNKLAGMTGTAKTEEDEFRDIYNMYVIQIPTNKPVIRIDNADQVYVTQSLRDKITLSFIKAHLKKYIKEYTTFHRMYMAVLYTLIPQYVILIVSNVLLGMKSMYVLCFFAGVKLIICFLVRINVDSNRVSIYRKK